MYYDKQFLLKERDRLFDEYLDTLDKIKIWKKKVNVMSSFLEKRTNKQIISIMRQTLDTISVKLTYLDYAISNPQQANIYYKIYLNY